MDHDSTEKIKESRLDIYLATPLLARDKNYVRGGALRTEDYLSSEMALTDSCFVKGCRSSTERLSPNALGPNMMM